MDIEIIKFVLPISLIAACATATQAQESSVGEVETTEPSGSPDEPTSDEPGALTPKGTLIIEPSVQYIHSSATNVAIEGFTIIPSIAIGLIEVSELQRDTFIAAVSGRYGVTNRFEIEAKIPYVYRDESVRGREIFEASPTDIIQDSDGSGLGDVEFAMHYQLNRGLDGWPYFIGNLRVKSRTGDGPFDVNRTEVLDDEGNRTGDVLLEQPTGSGFWGIQPSLTVIFPADPAVLYGSISYLWNVEENVGGSFGNVDPGDAVGFSFGMGYAVNEQVSFSLGYDHSIVFESDIENDVGLEPTFDRIQVGSFLVGFAYRPTKGPKLNLSLGMGVTPEAPDVQLSLRTPIQFD